MTTVKIQNFEVVFHDRVKTTWLSFDVILPDGAVLREVSLIDDGTGPRLRGAEKFPELREVIVRAATEEAKQRSA